LIQLLLLVISDWIASILDKHYPPYICRNGRPLNLSKISNFHFFSFFVVLELLNSCLLGKFSTTSTMPPAFFDLVIF
jgi:hypothetical protein